MKKVSLKRTHLLYIYLSLLFVSSVKGQQVSLFNHYFYNPTFYNPAFTGDKGTTNVMLISRNQWSGFKGSPKLNFLTVDGSILNNKMGIGLSLFSDTKGINNTFGGNLLYSYRIKLNEISKLRFGISVRFLSHSINFNDAIVENNSDPTFYSSKQNTTSFDGNIGLAYFFKDLEVGFSLNQIVKGKSVFSNNIENDITYTPAHHYIGSAKYMFTLNREKQIKLAPQAMVRFVPKAPLQYELNTNLYLLNKFWVGASYKSDYAIGVNAGITLMKKLDVGYSYDIITSSIGQYAGISHELMVNFKFGKRKPKEKIEEPVVEEIPSVVEDTIKEEPKEDDLGIRIITASADDYENSKLHDAKKGVYVIIGTFSYRELAEKFAKKTKASGYREADFVYSLADNYNYVYMFKASSKKDAINKIEEAREKGSPDAWILILTD